MFKAWPKIPRLENEVYHITEKIDGTNACIIIVRDSHEAPNGNECYFQWGVDGLEWQVYAQSRTRLIIPEDDNFGFAKWVQANAEQLINDLGEGYHFGEWWGQGINRGYGLDHKRFSLFNPTKYSKVCYNVPVLGSANENLLHRAIEFYIKELTETVGSFAVDGYMQPEGLVVYAEKAKCYWKVIIDK